MPTDSNVATSASMDPTPNEINAMLALFNQRRYAEAEHQARDLLLRFPTHGFLHKALGAFLRQKNDAAGALAAMQQAAALLPGDAEVHYNLAAMLKQLNRFIEAETSYRQSLVHSPSFAHAHLGLGHVLNAQKRFHEAEISYRQALQIKPDLADAFEGLAQLFAGQGDWQAGLKLANQYLQVVQNRRTKSFFVQCVTRANIRQMDEATLANILRALAEPWCNPGALTPVGAALVKSDESIRPLVQKTLRAWPERLPAPDLFGASGVASVANHSLLKAMLVSASICDIPLERFLTTIRTTLLSAAESTTSPGNASNSELDFYCALARQCFINEYVYACTDEENERARKLLDTLMSSLDDGADIPALWVVAVAAYFPLHTLSQSECLLQRMWPDAVNAMLVPLVAEPLQERQLRATMSQLTPIEGEVSLSVRNMYEENPYPRWIKLLSAERSATVDEYLNHYFPLANYRPLNKEHDLDILVAGCGTGQHSIGVAQKFKDARVLAIDLSLTSLSYAKRKSQEFGLTNVDYAQADIMKLGGLNRGFDVIESGGVLHHLADPWAGWRVLLSLLRPGGVMGIALYSEVARRGVVKGRKFIAERGYASTLEGIRQCRQDLIDLDESADFDRLLKLNDFFSTSDCRDLLFHVQEHRMTLTGIDAFLRENDLTFLGFQIKAEVLAAYKMRFPNDPATTNLSQWQMFENENPDTFIGMYQFWLQKPG